MAHKKRKEQVFYMRLRSLLLSAVAKVALASVVGVGSVGQDMSVPVEGGILIELEKKVSRKMARKKGRSRFFPCACGRCFFMLW